VDVALLVKILEKLDQANAKLNNTFRGKVFLISLEEIFNAET